jgi:luciferase family oxidoreductase group 1
MGSVPISALEILISQGHNGLGVRDVLKGAVSVAHSLEEIGYRRVWYPEHHRSPYAGDFPPGIIIAHVAANTRKIRVGSGGVLAPNHLAMSLSEQFGTLASLHPGRVDMGIGRGPGTLDQETALALRHGAGPATDDEYRTDVKSVLDHVSDRPDTPDPWLLCSSAGGASLAAELGLPMVFAHHIRPENAVKAIECYRTGFKPSAWREHPKVMLCVQTVCAETDEAAERLARPAWVWKSVVQARGVDQPLLDPETAADYVFSAAEENVLEKFRPNMAEGSPGRVKKRLLELADAYSADELMLTTPIHDPKARARSFELVAQALGRDG